MRHLRTTLGRLTIIFFQYECRYSVGKKPPTPILCKTEKMEQNSLKYLSSIIKFYVHKEDDFTSLPVNFGAIRWRK